MLNAASPEALGSAFADPVLGAQRVFRAVLTAMSEPGRVHVLDERIDAPATLDPTSARLLLTLADYETPIWLPPSMGADAAAYIRFHCSAPIAGSIAEARFAVIDGAASEPALAVFDAGNDRYPDRSATVIIACVGLSGGPLVTLVGPGIESDRIIAPRGLRAGFWDEVAANHARYPLGVDLVLVAGDAMLALPRTTSATLLLQLAETR